MAALVKVELCCCGCAHCEARQLTAVSHVGTGLSGRVRPCSLLNPPPQPLAQMLLRSHKARAPALWPVLAVLSSFLFPPTAGLIRGQMCRCGTPLKLRQAFRRLWAGTLSRLCSSSGEAFLLGLQGCATPECPP